jgi:hypothetical protein
MSRDLMQATRNVRKLTMMVIKLENWIKQERVMNMARFVNILDLEQKFIALGEDPNDKDGVESLVKSKDKKIQVLKYKSKNISIRVH